MPSSFFAEYEDHLDPTLFGEYGEVVRGTVRVELLSLLYSTFDRHHFTGTREWTRAWIAGSGVSYQWSAARDPGDLDILVGIKYEEFRHLNPDYRQMSDVEISQMMNEIFRLELQPHTENWHGYEVTFYVFSGRRVKVCPCDDTAMKNAPRSFASIEKGGPAATSATLSVSTSSNSSTSAKGWASPVDTGSQRSAQGADPGQQLAPLVGKPPTKKAGSAFPASSDTSEIGTTTGNTGYGSKTTKGFWSNRAGSARSVSPPTQTETAGTSASITATAAGVSGDFSASRATRSSEDSGTATSRSKESCGICGGMITVLEPSDIRTIKPYAAYNLTDNNWTVFPSRQRPSIPPEWEHEAAGLHQLAQLAVRRYSEAHTSLMNAPHSAARISAEQAMEGSLAQAAAMFDQVHEGRKVAFGPGGMGYADRHNFLWQAAKRDGWLPALREMKNYHDDLRNKKALATYGVELPDTDTLIRRAAQSYASQAMMQTE